MEGGQWVGEGESIIESSHKAPIVPGHVQYNMIFLIHMNENMYLIQKQFINNTK